MTKKNLNESKSCSKYCLFAFILDDGQMAAPVCSQAAAQNWSGLTDINKIFKYDPQQQLQQQQG